MPESQQQNTPQKPESNGSSSPGSDGSTDSKFTPPEPQSPLHWLADLAEQKAREEKKGNSNLLCKYAVEECNQQCAVVFLLHCGFGSVKHFSY